jgi:DHA2 family multidrug resistance protein
MASPSSDLTHPVPYRGIITAATVLGAGLQGMDTLLAAVALPHIRGAMSLTHEEATWILTSYLIAVAIATPPVSWIGRRIGRKRLFLIVIGGFIVCSMFAGSANNISEMVVYRFLQGVFGAALVPLSMHILLDVYPREEHGLAISWWSMGVMFSAIAGPTLGGFLTEFLSWRWNFYVNIPLAGVAFLLIYFFVPESKDDRKSPFDWFGFIMLTLCLGAMQLVLDRGNKLDWFSSPEILLELGIACAAFYVFIGHIMTSDEPFIEPAIFKNRNLIVGMCLTTMHGVILVGLTGLLPSFLNRLMDVPVLTIGLIMAPRGIATALASTTAGRIMLRFSPKYVLFVGMSLMAASLWMMKGFTPETETYRFIVVIVIQGFGFGLFFVSGNAMTFATLPAEHRAEATAFMSLMRKIGSSAGVSVLVGMLSRNAQRNHEILSRNVSPMNEVFRHSQLPDAWSLSDLRGMAALDKEITRQAEFIAYLFDFQVLCVVIILMMPLIFLFRSVEPAKRQIKKPGSDGH